MPTALKHCLQAVRDEDEGQVLSIALPQPSQLHAEMSQAQAAAVQLEAEEEIAQGTL